MQRKTWWLFHLVLEIENRHLLSKTKWRHGLLSRPTMADFQLSRVTKKTRCKSQLETIKYGFLLHTRGFSEQVILRTQNTSLQFPKKLSKMSSTQCLQSHWKSVSCQHRLVLVVTGKKDENGPNRKLLRVHPSLSCVLSFLSTFDQLLLWLEWTFHLGRNFSYHTLSYFCEDSSIIYS